MLPLLLAAAVIATTPTYKAEVETWRTERETRLKAEDGWLTVAGLFWLKDGENRIGSSEKAAIVLPKTAPPDIGAIQFANGKATLQLNPGVNATIDGKPASTAELRSDADPKGASQIKLADLTFFVIKRGDRYGLRLKDKNSEMRRDFKGLDWFPVDANWRIEAKWVPYETPKKLVFDSITGDKEEAEAPGYALFTINGKEYKLEPSQEKDDLFFVFRDRTAGKITYPAARFLYAKLPKAGEPVVLDFNKAYNPPCAFTPYATCPLPLPGNRLPIEIRAGELKYKGSTH